MRTDQRTIRPLIPKLCAYDTARAFYAQFSNLNFEDDLIDYLRTGFVVSQPDCFAMAKVVNLSDDPSKPDPAWFIRMLVGPLPLCIRKLPFFLPKTCFCRNNEDRLRVVDTKRAIELSFRKCKIC